MKRAYWLSLGVVALRCGAPLTAAPWESSPAALEFFETRIRPILVEHCYSCHSGSRGKIKGGLELDWKGGWEKGGDSGPVIVPGHPDQSRLVRAVRYDDPELQMPPNGRRLTPAQVTDLARWVEFGAPDPRLAREKSVVHEGPRADRHWAFLPLSHPDVPSPARAGALVKNELDAFVLAQLEAHGVTPNPPAEKRTLIRRAYYDLIGLPPSLEDVQKFIADSSPQAFEKVVDHLLASPHYGERWGRHWLDVARYSDSKGQYDRRRESSIYPYAWTYRDYVIAAFNQDIPYDRFVLEQLAADQLTGATNRATLAALGFLTLGDHFSGNPNDIINDRIDVTTKAFLGLTVSCARCHDHKFDPIPQADYYSLHGIFASSVEPLLKPEISDFTSNPDYKDYLAKRRDLDARLYGVRTQQLATVYGDYQRLAGVYLFATRLPESERTAYVLKMGGSTNLVKAWQQLARGGGRQARSVFGVWNVLSRIPEDRFARQAGRALQNLGRNLDRPEPIHPFVLDAFKDKSFRTLGEVAAIYGVLFSSQDPAWQATMTAVLSDAALRFLPNRERARVFALREQSDRLELSHPGAPARAPILVDSPVPKDSPIFIRGESESRGAVVPRRFLQVIGGPERAPFRKGSGRLELAQAIASPTNPMTARVWVNRIWLHHFGEGLVSTPDDFGMQTEDPVHLDLLDYLAARFMREGWSTKRLHKLIMLSAVYQRSSEVLAPAASQDPANRWLWRANVRRLEFEPLRDSIFCFGGNLDLTVGGHAVDLSQGRRPSRRLRGRIPKGAESHLLASKSRRAVYGFIDRADPLEDLNTFDFASPDSPTGRRHETTVPQQALYLMNSAVVLDQVRSIVEGERFRAERSDEARIRYLYELFYQREPTTEETRLGLAFVREVKVREATGDRSLPNQAGAFEEVRSRTARAGAWQQYGHGLLLANEAAYLR